MDSRAHHPTDAGVLPRRFGSVLLVISISLTVPALVSGQSARLSIDHLSFLTGCWAGTMGTLDMQEQWSELERGGEEPTTVTVRDRTVPPGCWRARPPCGDRARNQT